MSRLRKIFISHCWDYDNDYNTIKTWLDNALYYTFSDYSISIEKKLLGLNNSELKTAIAEQIRQCSVFIVPTAVYSSCSDWVKFEVQTAVNMGKPILAVVPWGQKHNSVLVTTCADKTFGWNSNSVIDGIKELTK